MTPQYCLGTYADCAADIDALTSAGTKLLIWFRQQLLATRKAAPELFVLSDDDVIELCATYPADPVGSLNCHCRDLFGVQGLVTVDCIGGSGGRAGTDIVGFEGTSADGVVHFGACCVAAVV